MSSLLTSLKKSKKIQRRNPANGLHEDKDHYKSVYMILNAFEIQIYYPQNGYEFSTKHEQQF